MPETSEYYQPELTLPDLLNRAALFHPELFIGYVNDDGSIKIQTYKDLLAKAKMITSGLYNLGLKQGEKIIIATQYNQDTIELLWGCFLLGIVPTILQPPLTFSGYNPSVQKLMTVSEQLGQPYIFTNPELSTSGNFPPGKIMHKDDLDCNGNYPIPNLKADDLAFIQYSSGSTGDPKGIMLSHNNLMVNMDAIRNITDWHYPDRSGNWMPLFHDMGLIIYHLTSLYCKTPQYHIEIMDFIKNPILWLNLLSETKITMAGCTNFGLALVLRHLRRKRSFLDWDFSSVKTMTNAAEPISVKVMQEFVSTLQPFGFHPEAMKPAYGMAEATVAITGTPITRPVKISVFNGTMLDQANSAQLEDPSATSARILSEVGVVLNDIEVRIMDDEDQPLESGIAGHIQVRGPSITKGYYNNPQATASVFCGEWLRTGDIGFFFEGNLYISGRYKDIIFKNGRNYFSNDLETMAYTLHDITYGKICFGATTIRETGSDKIIAFLASTQETKAIETFRQLRALLRSNLGITVDEMVLIKSNEIPKTSSGKIQRYKLMQRYINKEFDGHIISADKLN